MFIEILKVILLGVIEGITEWLPVSSTGHLLIFDAFITLEQRPEFKEMFFVVIQLGAIMAVVLLMWNKMFPFQFKDKNQPLVRKDVFSIWLKTVVACIPGGIALIFDDWIEQHLKTPVIIAIALIVYGVLFIVIEAKNKNKQAKINSLNELTYSTALYIGLFQVLSIIPGTSRSGATIFIALLIGVSRQTAAEFSFFLAVPAMLGYSLIKLLKLFIAGFVFTFEEAIVLLVGVVVAFVVSIFAVKFLLNYIKKESFQVFGYYRIGLGLIIIILSLAHLI